MPLGLPVLSPGSSLMNLWLHPNNKSSQHICCYKNLCKQIGLIPHCPGDTAQLFLGPDPVRKNSICNYVKAEVLQTHSDQGIIQKL